MVSFRAIAQNLRALTINLKVSACRIRSGLLKPLHLSMSWILTVSYQLFIDAAVKTIAFRVNSYIPSAATWLNQNIEMIVFIYAFSWIFVLSSVILSVILGKERSVLTQFVVVLTLTLLALSIQDTLQIFGGIQIQQLFSLSVFLNNPFIAGFYLLVPYLVMLLLDVRSRRIRKKREELKNVTAMIPEL